MSDTPRPRRAAKLPDRLIRRLSVRLARERAAAGLTHAALARAAGLTRAAIGQYERGESVPTLATLHALATAMGCTVAQLAGAIDGSSIKS